MLNYLKPEIVRIKNLKDVSSDSKLFVLEYKDKSRVFKFIPGQFVMVGMPGFGEAAFDICSSPFVSGYFEISVRKVGLLTERLHKARVGDNLAVRGPFGNGLPHLERSQVKNFVFIGGGCGFVTIRSLIKQFIEQGLTKERKVQVFYGAKTEDVLLFRDEYEEWKKYLDFHIALECLPKKGSKEIVCSPGMLTDLLDKVNPLPQATIIMCGPPIMYKFVIKKLKEFNVRDEDIYIFFERRMYCGIGVCQHCAIDKFYVCKDGPVFNLPLVHKFISF